MKILVPIRQVIDHAVRVRVQDGEVVKRGVRMSINPYDENALEAAITLREGGFADEVIVALIGDTKAQMQLRTAIAMGADKAIMVDGDCDLNDLAQSKVFAKIVENNGARLALVGKLNTDSSSPALAPMIAAALDWPQVTFASSIKMDGDFINIVREIDGGTQEVKVNLPAVISCDLNLNVPRKAKLPDVIKAKKAPIEVLTLEGLGMSAQSLDKIKVINICEPPARIGKRQKLADAGELSDVLRKLID